MFSYFAVISLVFIGYLFFNFKKYPFKHCLWIGILESLSIFVESIIYMILVSLMLLSIAYITKDSLSHLMKVMNYNFDMGFGTYLFCVFIPILRKIVLNTEKEIKDYISRISA